MDTAVLAICLSKLKKVASGVKKVEPSADGTKLIFTLNDGANTKINVSIPNPVTTYQLCNKLSIDAEGYLLYDGKRVSDFTDAETALLKKFSISSEGKLLWNGQPIGSGSDDNVANWTTNISVGGLNSGVNLTDMTALEILKKITKKYTNASCTVTWSETNTLFQVGDVINLNVSVSNFTSGDYNCSKIALYKGSTLLEEKTASGTVTFSTVNNITTDTTFTVKLTDANNVVTSYSKAYKFIYPSYTGSCANIPTSADVIGMTKLLREKAVLTQGFTASNSHLVFCSPKSYGAIKSIKDPNNFENLTSFIKIDMAINGIDYYVYYTKNKITCTNFKYTFNY